MRHVTRALVALALAAAPLLGVVGSADAATVPVQHPGYHPCAQEDSPGPCWWDAGHYGNGIGHSFYVTRSQRVVYGHLHWRVLSSRWSSILPDAHPCKIDKGSRGDATTCLTVGPWHRTAKPGTFTHLAHTGGGERLVVTVGGRVELS